MPRRILRFFAIAFVLLLLVAAAAFAYLSYTRFYRYQAQVDRIVHAIPVQDRLISSQARDVFMKLDGEAMPWIATRCLLYQVAPGQVRMSEWHVRGFIWQSLLPTRLSEDEILAVYANCMFFGEGQGVSFGAKRFYGKRPSDLTAEEAIGLVAIFRRPSASPLRNEDRFREMVNRLERRYRSALANST